MNRLSLRLSETDARAVDVLLDQSVSGGITRGPSLSAADMAGVSRTLELLSMLPEIEPSAGLSDRVMRAVDASGSQPMLSSYSDASQAMHA